MKTFKLGSRVYVKKPSLLLAPAGSRGTVIEIMMGGYVVKLDGAAAHGIPSLVFLPEELGNLKYVGIRTGRMVMVKGYSAFGNDWDGKRATVVRTYEDGHMRIECDGVQGIVKRSQVQVVRGEFGN